MVEAIELLPRDKREKALKRANYNIFNLKAEEVFIDFLTDSGTGAMSQEQWASLMLGDESYAHARSFERFQKQVQEFTGLRYVIPTHQGRAAENVLFGTLLADRPGSLVVSNQSFDTTVGHILYNKAKPQDIVIEEGLDPQKELPFKGNIDLEKLVEILEDPTKDVSVITLVLTNNAGGGQPVSFENIAATAKIAKKYGIPFFLDIARIVENSYFIQQREKGFSGKSLKEIVKKTCQLADGVWMSAKKDGYVNIGGFIALKDEELANKLKERLILFEGFPTYGGLAGRDLEAIATGLEQAVSDEKIVRHRISQVAYLHARLKERGIPVVNPPGGHAVFIDAKSFLPHIPPEQFPAHALTCALYLEGGIRGVEIGSLMFGREEDGKFIPAPMEFVRLAIPRRVYEKGHFDYVAKVFEKIKEIKHTLTGYRITEEPELLRHFLCKLEPIK